MRFRLFALLTLLTVLAAAFGAIGGCGTDIVDAGRDCTPEEAEQFGCESCPYTCNRDAGADADAGDATTDEEDAGDAGG
jgi:hypothetical protein